MVVSTISGVGVARHKTLGFYGFSLSFGAKGLST